MIPIHSIARRRAVLRRLSLACLAALATVVAFAQSKVMRWHDRLDQAVEAAKASGKPIFIVFRCVR